MARHIKKIAVLHSDVKRSYFSTEQAYQTEKTAKKDAVSIATYAKRIAREVVTIPAGPNWIQRLLNFKPDVIVNVVDSFMGDDTKTPLVCATLEILGIPFTGNGMKPIYECYDKFRMKQTLQKYSLPTPHGFLITKPTHIQLPVNLQFPVIMKLNSIHGSVGLSDLNIVFNKNDLEKRASLLWDQFKSDILVEQYIEGKEISIFIYESGNTQKVIMSEDILKGGTDKYAIASYEFRWVDAHPQIETRMFTDSSVEHTMRIAFERLGMRGYSKFDARFHKGIPYIIDVNPNPSFCAPENDSPFAKTAHDLYNIPFEQLLEDLLHAALRKNP